MISSKSALENINVAADNFRKFSVFTAPCSRRSACGFSNFFLLFLSAKTISYMRNQAINFVRLVERAYKIFLRVSEEF